MNLQWDQLQNGAVMDLQETRGTWIMCVEGLQVAVQPVLLHNYVTASLGSDTGGSVRCPSSFCSVVGFKPTYGLVVDMDLFHIPNSLEQIGPVGRTVSDVKKIMEVISGKDTNDNTTIDTKNNINNNHYDF